MNRLADKAKTFSNITLKHPFRFQDYMCVLVEMIPLIYLAVEFKVAVRTIDCKYVVFDARGDILVLYLQCD